MKKQITLVDFIKKFPTDEACLDYVFQQKYSNMEACPDCGVIAAKYYPVKNRKSYVCGECGNQIYPLAGTVMHGTTTSLVKWFQAIFMFATSKNGISAHELKRMLGVTYKTAWRIGHKVRELMQEDFNLSGIVEMDETMVGGRTYGGKRGWGSENKTTVFGMVERGGRLKLFKAPDRKTETLIPIILDYVDPGTMIYTDEYRGYRQLNSLGYGHKTVIHCKYQWSCGEVSTNSMEGFWSNCKKWILGTHTLVTRKYLQAYLNEYAFRYNRRKTGDIFESLLVRI